MKDKKPTVKNVKKMDFPNHMPKKMTVICSKSGTTNPDKIQKH